MFTELIPVVRTPDLARALRFYRDALGGSVTHEHAGADGVPVYVEMDIGSSSMVLVSEGDVAAPRQRSISVWIDVDDCDAAVERLRANGVRIAEAPKEEPWGGRVARVLDPDGNELVVGRRGDASRGSRDSVGASLVSPEPERYTRPEFERRFLVSVGSAWRDRVEPFWKTFDDLYIRHTHLRLRTLADSRTGSEFVKLTKKLESSSPYVQRVASLPVSPMEHELISRMEGERITKQRFYHFHHGNVFSIDVFQGELSGLVLCEVETGSLETLMQVDVPDYAGIDVTEDPFFTGGRLSRTSRGELARKLATLVGRPG
jgi:lactoylglutathione lyase